MSDGSNSSPKKCEVCGTTEKPQIFKGDPWCSDRHRKVFNGEKTPTIAEVESMSTELFEKLGLDKM